MKKHNSDNEENKGPMQEDRYWRIVGHSLKYGKEQTSQYVMLVEKLRKLTPREVLAFEGKTSELMRKSYRGEIWLAADLMMGKCTADDFENFRYWLISRGKKVFNDALTDPDSLVEQFRLVNGNYKFALFANAPNDALTDHTDKRAGKIIEDRLKVILPEIDLSWLQDIHKAIEKCPRLVANRLNYLCFQQIFQYTERNKTNQQPRRPRRKK